jgi:hypothetical protein
MLRPDIGARVVTKTHVERFPDFLFPPDKGVYS